MHQAPRDGGTTLFGLGTVLPVRHGIPSGIATDWGCFTLRQVGLPPSFWGGIDRTTSLSTIGGSSGPTEYPDQANLPGGRQICPIFLLLDGKFYQLKTPY